MYNIEEKYLLLLSSRFRNFKKTGQEAYSFSCPVCGDSKKSRSKARCTYFVKKNTPIVRCFNCNYSKKAQYFIQDIDPSLYFSLIKEKIKNREFLEERVSKKVEPNPVEELSDDNAEILSTVKKISDLDPSHPARRYCKKRMIPENRFDDLYYTPRFKRWVNRFIPGKFKNPEENEEPRLIIFSRLGNQINGFIGRSFDPKSKAKYISIALNNTPRLFWAERVDLSRQHWICEGPIDAMFLPDCIAVGTSSIYTAANKNSILIPDNQPRNPDIVKIIERCIKTDCKGVVLWPEDWSYKDINDAILAGITQNELLDVIKKNTYSGLMAELKFANWRRV